MSKNGYADSIFFKSLTGLGIGILLSKILLLLSVLLIWVCSYLPVGTISSQMAGVASHLTYPIISISIAYMLNGKGITLLSSGILGAICSLHPGVGALFLLYVMTFIGVVICNKIHTSFDYFIIPVIMILFTYLTLTFLSPLMDKVMGMVLSKLFVSVKFSNPMMACLISSSFALLSSLPLEIGYVFTMHNIYFSMSALTAALCGFTSSLLGFGIMSLESNKLGEGLAVMVTSPVVQIRNIIKNPIVLLPPILSAICSSEIAVNLLHVGLNSLPTTITEIFYAVISNTNPLMEGIAFILLPLFFNFVFVKLLRKLNWIKHNDLTLPHI